ncbi:MAG: gluconokinase [Jatrophihabitans sp.]|nr:MAG: gluconokinase [Jatrophihabitans sp.]
MGPGRGPVSTAAGRPVLVVMGVSGCGKSTVAALLAGRLGWPFAEGDDFHPAANVAKMHSGHPLDDDDRWPWLEKIAVWVDERLDTGSGGVITCSALKRRYRDVIRRDDTARSAGVAHGVVFVYLHGTREQIANRLAARQGHFMPAALLDSQFAALEEPQPDENAIRVEIGDNPAALADEIVSRLDLSA